MSCRWLPVFCLLLAACAPAPRPLTGVALVLPRVPEPAQGSPAAPGPTPESPFLPPASTSEPEPTAFPSILPTTAPATPTPVPPGAFTLAGGEAPGFGDGPGTDARFESPFGVAVDALGNTYVADTQNHRIRRVAPDGTVTTLAGSDPGYQDGPGAEALFDQPVGIAIGRDGALFVTDSSNGRVRMLVLDAAGNATVSTIAGNDLRETIDGAGTEAAFNLPYGLAVDRAGRLYITDRLAQVVRRIDDPTGAATVTTLAGETETLGDTDGPGAEARFAFPTGIAVDDAGTVYVAEEDGCRLRQIGADGVVSTLNADAGGCGLTDGPLTEAQFFGPAGLAIDAQGLLYVADTDNSTIRRVDPSGGSVGTLVHGVTGFQDGPLATAGLQAPRGLAFGADGRLVVTDAHRVRALGL